MGRPNKRKHPVRRRPGSFAARLDSYLLPYAATHSGTPATFAPAISELMGVPVTPKQVWQALSDNCVPSSAPIPQEREVYVKELSQIWRHLDQAIFVNEKMFLRPEVLAQARNSSSSDVPLLSEVVGALSMVEEGKVGLLAFSWVEGKLTIGNIVEFFENYLVPLLNPYPAPCSMVILDWTPRHLRKEAQLRALCEDRGAMLIWNAPNSPDLNPVAKLWDAALAKASRRHAEIRAGVHGARPFGTDDLMHCFMEARMSQREYKQIFSK